jgi:UDP-N-acetyl-D-mannosaminuronic acid transferase (WecB/TagA/CpsF family)
LGLEWAWRTALEPRRLWKRYLLGNWMFLARVARERWSAPYGWRG